VVGLAVAGLTIYTATVEKSREYGILKAEGFTNPYLYRVVFEQSMITGALGFLLGAGVTLLLAPFAQDTVPQFVVLVRWADIAAALLRPTHGRVHVCGTDVTNMDESHLASIRRQKVGFVYQSFNLLEALTALENVRVVIQNGSRNGRSDAMERASHLLETFGL